MELTVDTPTISPEAAMALVKVAIAKAEAMGWQIAACVTDRAGVPVALWRTARVTQPPVGFAIDKAYTAASLGRPLRLSASGR